MTRVLVIGLAVFCLAQRAALAPEEQQQIDAQMRPQALDAVARVEIKLEGVSIKDAMAAISQQSGLMVRYDQRVPELAQMRTVALKTASLADALAMALTANGLAYAVTNPKSIFVYSDTPANRKKFTESIRTFPLAHAEPSRLLLMLVQSDILRPEGLRPVVVAGPLSRTLTARATADKMAEIEKFIAANDKR